MIIYRLKENRLDAFNRKSIPFKKVVTISSIFFGFRFSGFYFEQLQNYLLKTITALIQKVPTVLVTFSGFA